MWYQQMFVFAIYILIAQTKAGSDSRFNGGTSGLLATQQQHEQQQLQELNNEQQQQHQQLQVNLNAWQPLSGHNNWLILQATAATSMQRQQEQQHRLPVNYYAYNHRYNPRSTSTNDVATVANGNYKQVRANLNDSPSYVLAISQTMRRGLGVEEVANSIENRRQLPPTVMKDVQEVDMRGTPEVRDGNNFKALTNGVDVVADGSEKPAASVLDIDNYLAPFEQAVLKVRNFCDTLRSLISVDSDVESENTEDEEDEENKEEQDASITSSKLDGRARASISATSKEVQGRNSRLAATYQGRKLKKLKKKIQKLLLPLLFAYKLKFLTLIPVLIGGLTLLVGTTGLAGFFFALFTAVMSLKTSTGGHGSKAIVLKKI
ncbi:uncharacterized protein LOC117573447 [Drosophila albomicans]|uniref:Uncharacterized protein LOC117573447 n=1 Tax=Drosophila albomicans TaxID=7291 RepID=A0A9C6TA94_DROAB|nr:uncharacterized protein LOC117573447 [Drosophila albomicans]